MDGGSSGYARVDRHSARLSNLWLPEGLRYLTPLHPGLVNEERLNSAFLPKDAGVHPVACPGWDRTRRARDEANCPIHAGVDTGAAAQAGSGVDLGTSFVLTPMARRIGEADALDVAGTQAIAAIVTLCGVDLCQERCLGDPVGEPALHARHELAAAAAAVAQEGGLLAHVVSDVGQAK